jgi:hypothetical protein
MRLIGQSAGNRMNGLVIVAGAFSFGTVSQPSSPDDPLQLRLLFQLFC